MIRENNSNDVNKEAGKPSKSNNEKKTLNNNNKNKDDLYHDNQESLEQIEEEIQGFENYFNFLENFDYKSNDATEKKNF